MKKVCTLEINESIQEAQIVYQMKLSDIADQAHMSETTLWKMRNGQARTPDKIMSLAKATKNPKPIQAFCFKDCQIGQKLGFVPLNNIVRNQALMMYRSQTETKEFFEKLEDMATASMNDKQPNEYSQEEEQKYFEGFQEMLDVLHCFIEIVFEAMKIWGLKRIIGEIKKHNQKCIDRGYVREKSAYKETQ